MIEGILKRRTEQIEEIYGVQDNFKKYLYQKFGDNVVRYTLSSRSIFVFLGQYDSVTYIIGGKNYVESDSTYNRVPLSGKSFINIEPIIQFDSIGDMISFRYSESTELVTLENFLKIRKDENNFKSELLDYIKMLNNTSAFSDVNSYVEDSKILESNGYDLLSYPINKK